MAGPGLVAGPDPGPATGEPLLQRGEPDPPAGPALPGRGGLHVGLGALQGSDLQLHHVLYCAVQVRCDQAWNISIQYDRATANSFANANYISEHDRRLRTIK